jgi:hypothetical protein
MPRENLLLWSLFAAHRSLLVEQETEDSGLAENSRRLARHDRSKPLVRPVMDGSK